MTCLEAVKKYFKRPSGMVYCAKCYEYRSHKLIYCHKCGNNFVNNSIKTKNVKEQFECEVKRFAKYGRDISEVIEKYTIFIRVKYEFKYDRNEIRDCIYKVLKIEKKDS